MIALSRSSDLQADPDTCTRFVRGLAAEYEGIYTEIGWADMSGRIVCHALESAASLSVADRPYFQRAVQTGSFAIGDFMQGRISGAPVLAFSHPIRDASGVMTGVAFVNVDLRVLSASMKADVLGPDVTVSLVDRHGTVLARSADAASYIGVRAAPDQVLVMHERGEFATEYPGPDSVVRVFGVVTIRDSEGTPVFFVAVGRPRAPLVAAAQRRLQTDLAIVAVLGAGLLAASWLGSSYLIRRPLDRVLETTSSIAAGRLDARVRDVSGIREFDALGTALNDMAEKLPQRDAHLRRAQRLEAIGQLAGGIAHDFNNLLTVIIGYGESLRSHLPVGSPAADELFELRTSAERAAKLTQQLLAFSRQQVLQLKPLNVNRVIAEMHSLVARTIGGDIVLSTANAPDAGTVLADQAQLEQVILNLVINARDAMPHGGTITLGTRNVDVKQGERLSHADSVIVPAGRYVAFDVGDTGTGMNAETRARLFEPFFTTKGPGGTGLGLATVYGIVKQSGGFIFCDSEPGRGTRFTIYLPRTHERAAAPEVRAFVAPPGGTEAVLVVEDDDPVRSYIQSVLVRAGYRVVVAKDGTDAVATLACQPVDLLITDVKMPGMNGRMLGDYAAGLTPAVPVLFISGYAQEVLPTGATLPKDAFFLQKPFTPNGLLAKVRQTLDVAGYRVGGSVI